MAQSGVQCACASAPRLVFSCSGASDVGHLTDLAARELAKQGVGQMCCLAGIGGRVSGFMASVESAAAVLVLDGCPLDCGRRTMEQAGFKDFVHLRVTDLGFQRGQSPPTPERIQTVVQQATARFPQPTPSSS
ncbi:MAG TPA: putative zinc-binding protein [Thermoguttaceae bacterium]|nr:putative zinc-binding protein [Thermoguttaceae bacterium]HPP52593.1 putative zinc-binding protein [Thermoguttaceae bacterium]